MPHRRRASSAAAPGFTLIEVMVATTVFVVGVVGLAPIFLIAARTVAGARTTTYAVILAEGKMEQLRAESEDTIDALARNTADCCDFLDATGRLLGGGTSPPAGTAFIRQWSVDPLPASPDHVFVIQVRVVRVRDGQSTRSLAGPRLSDEARIVSLRTLRGTR
jgi:prepilin-type N-terminal cleavage/methylation domain-containing protein